MAQPRSLLGAVLFGQVDNDDEVLQHLEAALLLEVDPLDYCAHRFRLGESVVMERAAAWAGLAFAPSVPRTVPGSARIRRLDALAEARTIRTQLFNREVVYGAPSFQQFIALGQHVRSVPEFRRRFCVVPASAIRGELVTSSAEQLGQQAKDRLQDRWPAASAGRHLPLRARIAFVLGLGAILAMAALSPLVFEPVFLPVVGLLLIAPAALRLFAAFSPVAEDDLFELLDDAELPVYSLLIPLRDEAGMVPQLAEALRAIDYPPEKLDIKFVVEQRSADTVAAVKAELGDPRFQLVEVPDAEPRTKPKALNYALPTVRGEHVAVYDAEDIPDPQQLRLAASRFVQQPELDCLQAELVVDNAGENWLTALFAGEYAGQFGLMLPLLSRLRLPMPLGGTSNHFRVAALREVGGWDAYNVTEDADLGVRLSRLRYRAGTISSRTREEAPMSLKAWMRQRTRWMKGWMQTFIVHNRNPSLFMQDIGWRGFWGFQVYVGSMILAAPLHCVFLLGLCVRLIWPDDATLDHWDVLGALIVVIGYGGPAALVIAGLVRLNREDLLWWQLLLPVYWVLHSISAFRAVVELLTRPYFWAKTEHGRTRVRRNVAGAPSPEPVRQAE